MKSFKFSLPSLYQFLWTGTWLTIVFSAIYGYTNWHADHAEKLYKFYFDWELTIPLIPWMILPYTSLNLLTAVPVFILNPSEMRLLGRKLAIVTFIAGAIFYFFPAPIGFIRPSHAESLDFIFQIIWSLDKTSNTLPSLHITYSALTVMALWSKVNTNYKLFFFLWFSTICLAVLFTWQHHLLDIVGGVLLATGCHLIYQSKDIDPAFRWKP
ncbi:MAG: phosphatase PAP2 family protein [Bacteriovoracaceae bacterium]|nr:phosphatase PAP2 family protein [Bacteriovoracaceae bacterium]